MKLRFPGDPDGVLVFGWTVVLAVSCSGAASAPKSPTEPEPAPVSRPAEDPSRWVRLDAVTPNTVPYFFPTEMVLKGSGFYGLRSIVFVSPGGKEYPGRLHLNEMVGDSIVTARTPGGRAPWEPDGLPPWTTLDVIVSEAAVPGEELSYQQSDTLRNAVALVGPVPSDTLVFEYRLFSRGMPLVQRWSLDAMPLAVSFDPTWPASFTEDLWRGTLAWEDKISPGVPSFVRVFDPDTADIAFVTGPAPGARAYIEMGSGLTIHRVNITIGGSRIRRDGRSSTDVWLGAHEVGHALGLPHSHRSQDVMRWVGGLPWEDSGISEGDVHTLRALYADEPGY